MRRIFTFVFALMSALFVSAQDGWPAQYKGVMLQGFYWDSYSDTQWSNLESQADELAEFFNLIWIPNSAKSASDPSMGYNDLYWFTDYTSSFGNEKQLRSMINTFKAKGLGTIADVVINHRSTLADTWMSFPVETYNGVTYEMLPSDICADDDGGYTAANAEVAPTGANDTGDDFGGARDLDHTSQNVQTMVKAYLDMLLNDFGYAGFRYDMVKGYSPEFTGIYNTAAKPKFSVGEYWDGNATNVISWLDGTKVDGVIQSAAFDFPLKYCLNSCCISGTGWNSLGQSSLMFNPNYRRYAVTFVDNHDTYQRDDNNDEMTANVLAANAFILAAPGTPCIFLPHWKMYKEEIKQMIYARKAAGISNESSFTTLMTTTSQYAIKVNGDNGKSVVVLMGSKNWPATATESDYSLIATGDNFAYYLSRNAETAWADKPSGTYDNAISVTLSAISATSGAQVVYTLDGSTPTASSPKASEGKAINIPEGTTTLKAGLLIGGAVTGIITRTYTVTPFEPHDITICVNVDNVGWQNVNFHTWGAYSTDWPGQRITETKEVQGKTWYYHTYRLNSSDDAVNFVFCTNAGTPQTVDVLNAKTDKYYEISSEMSGAKYLVNDVTDQYPTGISGVVVDDATVGNTDMNVYTIDGRLVRRNATGTTAEDAVRGLDRGLYIVGGKKVVVR